MDLRRARPKRRALTPLLVAVGLVATVLAAVSSWHSAQGAADAEQRAQATVLAKRLQAATDDAGARLYNLAVAVRAARRPASGGFDPIAGRIVEQTTFDTIGFLLHVPSDRRGAVERRIGAPIQELTPTGELSVPTARAVHYPAIRAVGPHFGLYNRGVDLVSGLVSVRTALIEASTLRETRATMPVPIPRPLGTSTVLVAPVGKRGYIAGILPFETLVADLRSDTPGARFALYDGRLGLGGDLGRWTSPLRRDVRVAGRTWTLAIDRPRPATGETLAIAVIGLLITLVLGLTSRLVVRRERRAEAGRLAAEERSRRLAETSTDLLVVHDARGRFAYLSPACRELLGVEPASLLGRRPQELIHPEDLPQAAAALAQVDAGVDTLTVTLRLRRPDGTSVWVETRLRVLRDEAGRALEAHSTVRDISDRMAANKALADAEARFRSTFEDAPIGMAIIGLDSRYQRVNRALAGLLGRTRDEMEGEKVQTFTHPEDHVVDLTVRGPIVTETDAHRSEKRYVHANGETVWAALSVTLVRDPDGAPLYVLSQVQDITERRRYEAELRHLADHDPLTGLLNRRSFERELERHVAHVERYGPRGAAMVLDLDHFKTINDTLGHGVGDELISRVAQALRVRLRASDVLARLGGDEFAVLLPEGGREQAVEVAQEVLATVRGQAVLASSGHARRVTASLGIALLEPGRRLTPDAVLVEADLAMYEAKEAGRDQYAIAAGELAEGHVGARISWSDMIRDALDDDRFELHAQPIVDVESGRIGQYELLLRMVDHDGSLIAPGTFLPVAERFDLIGQIDRWVVRRAIAMLAEAVAAGHDITVEVNLSGASTGDAALLALIEAELQESRVDPARVIFEITETTAVANIPAAQAFAARLADLGCRFALDDFGAGFGSFYYLKHLPFDYLKIDGEFVRHCAEDRTDQLVIQAVVDIARGLGKRTVAEQAGDDATLALLRRLGVDQAQGYFLGRPAPLADWLAAAEAPAAAF